MNHDIKKTLINTFGTISYLVVIFYIITFILYAQTGVKDLFKESWTASLSFLSVLSTLGAAYIGSSLYTDWKKQTKYSEQLKNISSIIIKFHKIPTIIKGIRSDQGNAIVLNDRYKYITGLNNKIDETLEFNIPDFNIITNLIEELQEALILIKVYSFSTNDNELTETINQFKHSLSVWMDIFHKIKNDFETPKISNLNIQQPIDYIYIFCDANSEFYYLNITDLGLKYSIYNHNEIDIFHDQMAVLIAVGEFLERLEKL
ncbi:hypothetical protein ACK1JC_14885 [Acinetobacter sp. TY2]|uniref:hypothetical protein n=1 Tax=Acinetobacter sp. TY2 TaxID=3387403 RepID=UPI0039176F9C